MSGSQVAISGNTSINTITPMPINRNGIEDLNTSPSVTSCGAMAFIVKTSRPKGGLIRPSCIFISEITANQSVS